MGQFFFDGHHTAGTGSAGQPFADFLLGLPNRVRIGNLITNDYPRRSHAGFVQDHFQLTPRLTVNFGLRWEYLTPVWEDGGRGAALNPVNCRPGMPADALTNPTGTTIFALDPTLRTPYYQHWNLTVQREFRRSLSVELAYMGAKETNVYGQQDYNLPSLTTDPSIPFATRQLFPAVDPNGNLIPSSDIQAQIASLQ